MLMLDHISFSYPGTSGPVLDDVCLQIAPGSSLAIVGANGSGKSTLAAIAGGFLQAESGTITLDGKDLGSGADDLRLAHGKVGVVFQDPTTQIVANRVEDEVAFGPENLGLPAEQVGERVARSLKLAGLAPLAHRDPRSLSGGELQRLVVASALAMEPTYLFLDEPTAMLDGEGRGQVRRLIADLKDSGVAVVVITHSLEEAALCNEAVVLQEGKVVFRGTPGELVRSNNLVQWGLARCEEHVQVRSQDTVAPLDADAYAELDQVDFSYTGGQEERQVFKGCSVRFPAGHVSCLLGPNGSGKSTLLRLLAGLEVPQKGTVLIHGRQAHPGDAGFCMQHPDMQLFADTVEADVGFASRQRKLSRQAVAAVVSECLETVGLGPDTFGQRSPFSLSGGQARRVALAGVLAVESGFLLLDEPTVGLDAPGLDRLAVLIDELRGRGIGIVMACHDQGFAEEVADNLFIVDDGTVCAAEPGEVRP